MNLSLFLEEEVDFDVIEPVRVTEDGRVVEDLVNGNQMDAEENGPAIPFEVEGSLPGQSPVKKEQSQSSLRNEERVRKMRSFWPMLKQFIIK